MNELSQPQANIPPAIRVLTGEDRYGAYRGLGVSAIAFKPSSQDSNSLFVLENTFRRRGHPARHLCYNQDEWFYCVERW